MSNYQVQWLDRLQQVPQSAWDALALPLQTPFLEWEWLNNLEVSGSVTAETGWLPRHLTVWEGSTLVAAAPLYLKGHSYGEFVFDHQWADVSQRLGIRYYPKLVGMTPITPAEGYRFLMAEGIDELAMTGLMVQEIDRFCESAGISGCHFLYVDPSWQKSIEQQGFAPWLHHGYIWQNDDHQDFDCYLKNFNANQRRNIKRERKSVTESGLTLKPLTGEEVGGKMLPLMYEFYADTCDKFGYWGSKYLTPDFFKSLYPNYQHRVMLMAAFQEGVADPVGMSFCIYKGDRLYGRYWGSRQEFDCLHFDACYYSPIEWSIGKGIQMFDPGAGGRHKKRRGFPATPNYSMHRFYNHRLEQIILPYIREVNKMEKLEIEAINQDLPFTLKEVEFSEFVGSLPS
jgi:uncharacterized protein